MRSHHAPTRHLLERFTFKDRHARNGRSIWVYEKGKTCRQSRDLSSECAQHGYFAGSNTGETEAEIDSRFNVEYELPFNNLLCRIDSDLHIFDSPDVKRACSRFVAHLFHRARARRLGTEQVMADMLKEYRSIADTPKKLRAYAGKMSCLRGRSVSIEGVKTALLNNNVMWSDEAHRQTYYVSDLDRATRVLSSELIDLSWSVVRAGTSTSFYISDTPVVSLATGYLGEVKFGVGIRQTTAAWYLPISSRRAIRIGHRPPTNANTSEIETAHLNDAQVLTMSRRLYGRAYSPWIDDAVQRAAGAYKFHEHVFKGVRTSGLEDVFDDIMML